MEENRHKEWLDNTGGFAQIDLLLLNDALELGDLDAELILESARIKINSELEEERFRKFRHFAVSRLWVIGAYELVRITDEILSRRRDEIDEKVIKKVKETLTLFGEIRVPLVKLEKHGQFGKMFSGVPSKYEFDENKSVGWRIVSTYKKKLDVEIFYRKDLGDSLLDLFKILNKNICAERTNARN